MNGDANGAIVRLPGQHRGRPGRRAEGPPLAGVPGRLRERRSTCLPVPNWAPIRQSSADALNAVWADCGSDVKTEMEAANTKLTQELQNQQAS